MAREVLTDVTIVVVEDNQDFLFLVSEFLFRHGARVAECATLSVAIDCITRTLPDLVLTDITLPDGDGIQLLRTVQSLNLHSGTTTPVLAMSARCDIIMGSRVANAGFSAWLRKPFTPAQLLEAITTALRLDQGST